MAPKQETDVIMETPPIEEVIESSSPVLDISEGAGETVEHTLPPEGWLTVNAIAKAIGRSNGLVKRKLEPLKETNPELFAQYLGTNNRPAEHVHPELISKIKDADQLSLPPESWIPITEASKELGFGKYLIRKKAKELYSETQEEVLASFRNTSNGRPTDFLHPDFVMTLLQERSKFPDAPEEWKTKHALAAELGISPRSVQEVAEHYRDSTPEFFANFFHKNGNQYEYLHPVLVDKISSLVSEANTRQPTTISATFFSKELGVSYDTMVRIAQKYIDEHPEWIEKVPTATGKKEYTYYTPELCLAIKTEVESLEQAPDDCVVLFTLSKELGRDRKNLKRFADKLKAERPDLFRIYKNSRNQPQEFLLPEAQDLVKNRFTYKLSPPEGYVSVWDAMSELECSRPTLNLLIEQYETEELESKDFKGPDGRDMRYMHPQLYETIKQSRLEYQEPVEGWLTRKQWAKKLGVAGSTLNRKIEKLIEPDPDWFRLYKDGAGKLAEHLSPELISLITPEIEAGKDSRALKKAERELNLKFEKFVEEIAGGDALEANEVQSLIRLFPQRTADILFRYRPEYSKVDMPYAKRVIGDYLGEFLVVRGGLELDALELGTSYLSNPNLREDLRELFKSECLKEYNHQRREGLVEDDLSVFRGYLQDLREKTATFTTKYLDEVINEVEEYYKSLFEVIQIPESIRSELEPGRLFPDINQRINILELMGKQKMLIADEMGVGKSASAILAKESLGVRQALVVVPSNVIEVWQKYLSDYTNGDGSAKGYFKEGQAPRALTINNGIDSLNNLELSEYAYILVSQERLNNDYMAILEQLDYDMLIVDEAHKLKNITRGKRADNLIKLAERIDGEDKYLALLSGTPVPNKVGDIAMVLKLLYPEKFEGIPNKELTREILNGDVIDLRSLLVPRMQMKSLAESVEMPKLDEKLHVIQLSQKEREAYEVLLEEDELTATDKLRILRQFILNPQIFEMTPDLESTKIEEVGAALRSTYETKNKVVMFFNGYIENVIRGEQTIFDRLDLPEDVEIHVIDGKVRKSKRLRVQNLLQSATDKKILLAVSGQTADVGVDFSGAEELYFYNEPWTEYDKMQQQGRVYRPGLKQDLISHTFYVEGSIEEGIHKYIEYKYNAVEKLLRGIPLSELERELLKEDEKQVDPNLEVNPLLAESYLSHSARLLKIFSYVKEIGEDGFIEFGKKYWPEYANYYKEIGNRSYQANVGRLAGTVIDNLAKSKNQPAEYVRILDVASGPEMLKRHIAEEYQDQVVSVDINPHHFEEVDEKRRVGSFLDLPVADSTVDYANLSLALHYTKFLPSKGNYERVEVFKELNRVLVNEGVAVINLMHNMNLKDKVAFNEAIEKVGFKVVEELSGEVSSANNFRSRMIVLQKVSDCPQDVTAIVQAIGSPLLRGFKFTKTDVKLRDSRKIVTEFLLNSRNKLNARFNQSDQMIYDEEQLVLDQMKQLKKQYGSVQSIPRETIFRSGLARVYTGISYVLFKSLETGNGAVITR